MFDIKDYKDKCIYFIGIGGCSMSGLAMIMNNLGYNVKGSDAKTSQFTAALERNGIQPIIGQKEENIDGADLVVYTAAIKPTNPEFARAKQLGLPMLERSEMLGLISKRYGKTIGIAGCHGKTTITSMLALLTQESHMDPTVHVGGMVDWMGSGVRLGKGDLFITEACEYVRSFMTLHPSYIVINNIDDDHLDYFKDIDDITQTFIDFMQLLPEDGILFANPDDVYAKKVIDACDKKVITYSINSNGDYNAENVSYDEMGNPSYDVVLNGENLGRIKLNVPGMHNVQNSLAAIAVAHTVCGLSIQDCAESLTHYHLAGRRFQLMGEKEGVKIFHDYAHHPAEISACLDAAKRYPHKKLYVLFQCNSFTRARTLKDKYALAFDDADVVMVPDLYPGRDIDTGDIHAKDLVDAINAHSHNCLYLPTFEDIKAYLKANWQPGDIVVTVGSGDVFKKQMILLED